MAPNRSINGLRNRIWLDRRRAGAFFDPFYTAIAERELLFVVFIRETPSDSEFDTPFRVGGWEVQQVLSAQKRKLNINETEQGLKTLNPKSARGQGGRWVGGAFAFVVALAAQRATTSARHPKP